MSTMTTTFWLQGMMTGLPARFERKGTVNAARKMRQLLNE
jgi:hypothetical protein